MSSNSATVTVSGAARPKPSARFSWDWLGVVPFFAFAILFMFLPSLFLFVGAFQDNKGAWTLANIGGLFSPNILSAYWITIKISVVTAIGGGVLGFFVAYAGVMSGLPRWIRTAMTTFSGVASNFAGVPLAFAFISTLGRLGLVTLFLRDVLRIDLYGSGFSLYSFAGLSLTYMYFQFPLMILMITPALEGLKPDWRNAAENLGATQWQYWRHVAFPILLPSLLGTMILLFGNAFGTYATALTLTGGLINVVTILIGAQIKGDVLHNVGLGYALALGMIVVMAVSMTGYYIMRRRSERWMRM